MSKIECLQLLLTNDLIIFREPFFEHMEVISRSEASALPHMDAAEIVYKVQSLEIFERWTINGIVGGREPSRYSGSPGLWNPYFKALGKEGVFFPFDLSEKGDFSSFLRTMLAVPGFLELTVTDPYKAIAFEQLGHLKRKVHLSEQAERMSVVNHIILDIAGNLLYGLNTDGMGMIRAMQTKADIRGKKVLIIGAGGAAASIGYELARLGDELFIANRTESRAEALGSRLRDYSCVPNSIRFGGFEDLPGVFDTAEIIINTVSVGCPVGLAEAARLKEGVLLAETKYGARAELKALAELTGLAYVDGNEMLFGQFVEAALFVYPILGVSPEEHQRAVEATAATQHPRS